MAHFFSQARKAKTKNHTKKKHLTFTKKQKSKDKTHTHTKKTKNRKTFFSFSFFFQIIMTTQNGNTVTVTKKKNSHRVSITIEMDIIDVEAAAATGKYDEIEHEVQQQRRRRSPKGKLSSLLSFPLMVAGGNDSYRRSVWLILFLGLLMFTVRLSIYSHNLLLVQSITGPNTPNGEFNAHFNDRDHLQEAQVQTLETLTPIITESKMVVEAGTNITNIPKKSLRAHVLVPDHVSTPETTKAAPEVPPLAATTTAAHKITSTGTVTESNEISSSTKKPSGPTKKANDAAVAAAAAVVIKEDLQVGGANSVATINASTTTKVTKKTQNKNFHRQEQKPRAVEPKSHTHNSTVPSTAPASATEDVSACLLVMDDNHLLPEWLAYHYHALNLRNVIIATDPKSQTSPSTILDEWRAGGRMNIIEWTSDDDYMTPDELLARQDFIKGEFKKRGGISEALSKHRGRQQVFYSKCLQHFKRRNKTWVLMIDTDEYLTINQEMVTASQQRVNNVSPKNNATANANSTVMGSSDDVSMRLLADLPPLPQHSMATPGSVMKLIEYARSMPQKTEQGNKESKEKKKGGMSQSTSAESLQFSMCTNSTSKICHRRRR